VSNGVNAIFCGGGIHLVEAHCLIGFAKLSSKVLADKRGFEHSAWSGEIYCAQQMSKYRIALTV